LVSKRPRLSLDFLRVLDLVARTGSISGAARELDRVPSAVSYAIDRMQRSLGQKLVRRNGIAMELTELGAELQSVGLRMLADADHVERRFEALRAGRPTELRIAIDTVFDLRRVAHLVRGFDKQGSSVAIGLLEEVLGGTWDALSTGRADIAVAGLSSGGLPAGGGWDCRMLGEVPFIFVAGAGHELISRAAQEQGRPLDDAIVRNHRAIVIADSSRRLPKRSVGLIGAQQTLVVPNMAGKLAAIEDGLGVGFVPAARARDVLETGRLVQLAVAQPAPVGRFAVVWRRSNWDRNVAWWIDALLETLGGSGADLTPGPSPRTGRRRTAP
jgi:DNA-binding transcriptional LysR family regulator